MNKLITFPQKSSVLQRSAKVEQKSVPMLQYPAQLFFGIADKIDDNALRGLMAYAGSSIAYACMRYRATKIVEAPLWIAEDTPDGEQWLLDHPLSEVLERPNPDMEMADLLELTQLYMDATGRALWVKSRDRRGRVAALYPFSRDEFTVHPDGNRLYARFTVMLRTGEKDFAPEDVIFFRNVDPRYPLEGLAPLDAAIAQVNIGQSLRDAVRSQLKKAIRPGTLISLPDILDPEDRAVFKSELATGFAGAENTGKPMVLEGGGTIEQMPWTLKDLDLGPVQSDIEAAVCMAFQLHPALVGTKLGVENSGTWADTIAGAQNLFYDLFGYPTWSRIEKTLTRGLLREVDDNTKHFVRFDKSKVRALQADLVKRTGEANAAREYWTVNERRVHTNQPALPPDDPRGDEIGKTQANPFQQLADLTGGKELFGWRQSKPKMPFWTKGRVITGDAKSPTGEARTTLWKAFDHGAVEFERQYEAAALAQFRSERASIAKEAGSFTKSAESDLESFISKLRGDYEPGGTFYQEWLHRFTKLIEQSFEISGSSIAADLGFDFSLSNPKVQEAIAARVKKLTGNVTETTYEMIKTIISEGTANGDTMKQIADSINTDVFGDMADVRAIRIARTETIGALNAGEHLSAELSGVVQSKEWLTQGDDRVRDSHAAEDGNIVALNARFGNGLAYPGDQSGTAEEVINCRCTLLYHDTEA